MAERRVGLIILALCLFLCLLPCQGYAASTTDAKEPISTDKDCTLTVGYFSDGIAFSDLPVKLYKIADVSADFQYTLAPSFAASNLILNGVQTVGEWNVIRATLETYILANRVMPDRETVTGLDAKASFDTLKPGLYLAITEHVVEDNTTYIFDSALVALPGLDQDGYWQYQVDVMAKSQIVPPVVEDEKIDLKVVKLWKGDRGSSSRPKEIVVEIFCNGKSYQTVILSEANHWTFSWSAMDDGSDWKVVERNIPEGYTMTVEKRETSFVLTNTLRQNPDKPTPPPTGDTSNVMLYIILMVVSGSGLVVLGITGKRKRA